MSTGTGDQASVALVGPHQDSGHQRSPLSGAVRAVDAHRALWGRVLSGVVLLVVALYPEYTDISGLVRGQQILLYMMIAFGLNIGFGYAGVFALGQPVILGVSAYTAGLLNVDAGMSPWLTLPCSLVAGTAVGMLLSAPSFRLRGWYLAITTFFASVIFPNVVGLFAGLTGGTDGLAGIDPLPFTGLVLGSSPKQYWIILGIAVVLFIAMRAISKSTWGTVLRGVRDAPLAAQSCGVSVPRAKALAALVSSIPVAVAGWVMAHSASVISTGNFGLNLNILIIAGVVIGGLGSVWGPVLGTVLVGVFSLWISPFGNYNSLIVGLILVLFAIWLPHGIVEAWMSLMRRALGRFTAARGDVESGATEVADSGAGPPGSGLVPDSAAAGAAPARGSAQQETILDVRDVHKGFLGVTVLRGVDIAVHRHEIVGLVGPNGSGKTTLLNIITGHVAADSGVVSIFDRRASGRAPHSRAAQGIRRTFQVPRLIGELSVEENIRLGLLGTRRSSTKGGTAAETSIRSHRAQDRAIADVCELIGIGKALRGARVDALPLGLRRLVEVGRAVVGGAVLVCLDEPGAGLGAAEITRLGAVIRRVAAAGSGVLLIEHDLSFVDEIADRVVELHDGEVANVRATTAAPGAADGRSTHGR